MGHLLKLLQVFSKTTQPIKEEDDLYILRSQGPKRVVMVTLFEVARENHDEIIEKISKAFRRYDKIVYVTDIPDFLHFRDAAAAFEYLPSLLQQNIHRDALDWPSYLRARWELLLAKWQPKHVLAYGLNIERFLAASRAGSPGEQS